MLLFENSQFSSQEIIVVLKIIEFIPPSSLTVLSQYLFIVIRSIL